MSEIKIPDWAKGVLVILILAAVMQTCSHLTASPEQKAVGKCVADLNKAASGTMSRSDMEKMCLLMLQRGQLQL